MGTGENIRDWLFVEDHAEAILRVLERGRMGETYLIGGGAERRNLDIVHAVIADLVDELAGPLASNRPRRDLISFVDDRPGHDFRYAIDSAKVKRELGWRPCGHSKPACAKRCEWYLDNDDWWRPLLNRYARRTAWRSGPARARPRPDLDGAAYLLFGSTGQVGRELIRRGRRQGESN